MVISIAMPPKKAAAAAAAKAQQKAAKSKEKAKVMLVVQCCRFSVEPFLTRESGETWTKESRKSRLLPG